MPTPTDDDLTNRVGQLMEHCRQHDQKTHVLVLLMLAGHNFNEVSQNYKVCDLYDEDWQPRPEMAGPAGEPLHNAMMAWRFDIHRQGRQDAAFRLMHSKHRHTNAQAFARILRKFDIGYLKLVWWIARRMSEEGRPSVDIHNFVYRRTSKAASRKTVKGLGLNRRHRKAEGLAPDPQAKLGKAAYLMPGRQWPG